MKMTSAHLVKILLLFTVVSALTFLLQSFQFKLQIATRTLSPTDTLRIESGVILGLRNESTKISIFKGIPFAAPPVGELRWKAPHPASKWTGVKKCETFGPSPMQNSPAPFSMWSQEFLIPKEPI